MNFREHFERYVAALTGRPETEEILARLREIDGMPVGEAAARATEQVHNPEVFTIVPQHGRLRLPNEFPPLLQKFAREIPRFVALDSGIDVDFSDIPERRKAQVRNESLRQIPGRFYLLGESIRSSLTLLYSKESGRIYEVHWEEDPAEIADRDTYRSLFHWILFQDPPH